MEQLVLYMRALQLLSSAFHLAREEVKAGRLQPSNNVKSGMVYKATLEGYQDNTKLTLIRSVLK